MAFATTDVLTDALPLLRGAPDGAGTVVHLVRRPARGERELVDEAQLDVTDGMLGDTWRDRPSRRSADGGPHPDMQLTLMNVRMARLLAPTPDEFALAGDQLYVDLDLSETTLPPGAHLAVGSAVIVVTDQPHTGCAGFRQRFGEDVLRFVNGLDGRALRLRGMNTRIVQSGTVRVGDAIRRIDAPPDGRTAPSPPRPPAR